MDLVDIPDNPVPPGAVCGEIVTADNVRLRYARWDPPAGERRGTICLLTGRAEFIEKYFETIAEVRQRGFAVAALDWRGQGGSQRLVKNPRKGHVDSFDQYDSDLDAFMRHVVLPDCPPPFFALAHSMGGAVALRSAGRKPGWFERLVLSAPMLDLAERRRPGPVAGALVETLCYLGFGDMLVPGTKLGPTNDVAFEGNPFTSDPARFDRTNAVTTAEPALAIGGPTLGWVSAALHAMVDFHSADFMGRVGVPVLMVAAGDERVVSTRAIEALAFRLKQGSHVVLAGARHELLMERDAHRQQFWAAFDAFVPGTPAFA